MLAIALELAKEDPSYEDVASKFFEHFVYIAHAMDDRDHAGVSLWDEADGFYYDVLHADGHHQPLRVRSLVGLVPLFAVETLEPAVVDALPGFKRRMQWFIDNRPELREHVELAPAPDGGTRRLLSIVSRERLPRVLRLMLDEAEFLSPHGIRAVSRYHAEHPFVFTLAASEHRVDYEPAESSSGLFGGNSNWRGPIWFPMNYLLIESLQKFHHFYGDALTVPFPAAAERRLNLGDVAAEISRRLTRIFLRGADGRRPVHGGAEPFQSDPHWRDLVLFYEYFHGDNGAGIGASHQTGWTALVAKLLQQSGE
jgi:Glycosyl hydrolase family 63 C-terminal domain